MFEGKNIHFSPVDRKPLCSFSNKLCRQRRLNGYAFCIRHILEDKSAPFKRCTYVTRNNNQICQNAIPTSQERGYCHSHMQVAGIIPKTERKTKASVVKSDSASGSGSNKSDNHNSSSNSSSSSSKKDPNAVFKFEEESSEIQWIPKGGSINGIVNGGKTIISKGKDLQNLLNKKLNGCTKSDIAPYNGIQSIGKQEQEVKNGKSITNSFPVQNSGDLIGLSKTTKSRQTYSKKSSPVKVASNGVSNVALVSKPNDMVVKGKCVQEDMNVKVKTSCTETNGAPFSITNSIVTPERTESHFEQLKTLIKVERAVSEEIRNLQVESCNEKGTGGKNQPFINKQVLQTTLQVMKPVLNGEACKNDTSNSCSIDSIVWQLPSIYNNGSGESRQEFLIRVRQAFKQQYLRIKQASVVNEKKERVWRRALRNSLLTCVVKNPSLCAHFLLQNDASKCSPIADSSKNGCSLPVANSTYINNLSPVHPAKHKRPGTKNGTILAGDKKVKKCDTSTEKGKCDAVVGTNKSFQGTAPLPKLENCNKFDIKPSFGFSVDRPAPKVCKRNKVIKNDSQHASKDNLTVQKRKSTKCNVVSTNNNLESANGRNRLNDDKLKTEKLAIKSAFLGRENYDGNELSNTGINGSFRENIHVANKKMKLEIVNCGSEHETNGINGGSDDNMDSTTAFRVPKSDETSSNFQNSIDINIKVEKESLLANSFHNAQKISNQIQLHQNTSSSTSTNSVGTAQLHLQHLLNQPDLRSLAGHRNLGIDTVLNSVGSSDIGNSDSVITDASFDSTFDHSASSQQDCEFSDDDLGKSLEFQLDPEIESQASRLLEENELTEDLNELFPDSRIGDAKLGRSDLSDLGIDFSSFDANDVLFGNIFPFTRSNQSESISVTNQF